MKRFSLTLRHWLRESKRLRMQRFREEWALLHGEFEFVGGPYDGEVIRWCAQPCYTANGVYEHGADYRLHYQELASSWKESE
jgi:hypothetical protein